MLALTLLALLSRPGTVHAQFETAVASAPSVTAPDSSERGQVIGREQIVNLPLNGRSYASLGAMLSTGVLESNQNGVGTSGREGSLNTNELRNTVNNFQLDGVDGAVKVSMIISPSSPTITPASETLTLLRPGPPPCT